MESHDADAPHDDVWGAKLPPLGEITPHGVRKLQLCRFVYKAFMLHDHLLRRTCILLALRLLQQSFWLNRHEVCVVKEPPSHGHSR